jgi:RHS repeat-associated protein
MTAVFGLTAAIPRMSKTNPYQFTGRENDGTGLYYYRARYYSPTFQRFVGQDPLGLGGGDPNSYEYVYEDPTGLFDLLACTERNRATTATRQEY